MLRFMPVKVDETSLVRYTTVRLGCLFDVALGVGGYMDVEADVRSADKSMTGFLIQAIPRGQAPIPGGVFAMTALEVCVAHLKVGIFLNLREQEAVNSSTHLMQRQSIPKGEKAAAAAAVAHRQSELDASRRTVLSSHSGADSGGRQSEWDS